MKFKWKKVSIDLFSEDYFICMGGTNEDFKNFLVKKGIACNHAEVSDIKDARGHAYKHNGTALWVCRNDAGLIAHECFHGVTFMTDRVGITLSDSSDEVFAYAVQYLVNQFKKL